MCNFISIKLHKGTFILLVPILTTLFFPMPSNTLARPIKPGWITRKWSYGLCLCGTLSSNISAVYIHICGADVKNKVLAKAGIIKEDETVGESTLEAHQCPRCGGLCAYDMRYCPKCSLILDSKPTMEIL